MTTLEKLLSSQTLWVALVLAAIILYWKSRSPSVKNIPVIGEKAVGWQFWKQGHHFNENATSILEKGLAQVRSSYRGFRKIKEIDFDRIDRSKS